MDSLSRTPKLRGYKVISLGRLGTRGRGAAGWIAAHLAVSDLTMAHGVFVECRTSNSAMAVPCLLSRRGVAAGCKGPATGRSRGPAVVAPGI